MLKPPRWCKNARLTTKGWVDPETNELLVSRRTPRSVVEAYYAKKEPKAPVSLNVVEEPAVVEEPVFNYVVEEPVEISADSIIEDADDIDFEAMTKLELEAWAREELDIELDRRKSKSKLIAEIKENL